MPFTVLQYRSSVAGRAPSSSSLQLGQLALNTHDGLIYYLQNSGTASVVCIGPIPPSANSLTNPVTISCSGDASGSTAFQGNSNVNIALTLANSGVTAGTYSNIGINSKGLITSARAINSGDVTTGLGYTPVNKAGDTMTGPLNISMFSDTGVIPFSIQGNSNGTLPTFLTGSVGGAITVNYQVGSAEIDFFNQYYNYPSSRMGGFSFYQMTSATTANKVLDIVGNGLLATSNAVTVSVPTSCANAITILASATGTPTLPPYHAPGSGVGGGAIGWNYTNSVGEIDFFNSYGNSSGGGGFNFYQQTSANTANLVMSVYGANGIVSLPYGATTVTQPTADNTSNVATTAFVKNCFPASLGTSGYQKLPSGFIMQWGTGSVAGTSTITFPVSFPTACVNVTPTVTGQNDGLTYLSIWVGSYSKTGATFNTNIIATYTYTYFAIGY